MHFICFFQFVNGNLLLSFLFQKFANFLFIVMAINTKGLWYWVLFFIGSCEGSPISSNNYFLATGSFLLFYLTGFFMSSNVGTTLRLIVFLTCLMDPFTSSESKWNAHIAALFTLNLSFPPLRRNPNMLWSDSFLLFGVFGKWKVTMSVLILTLLSCVFLQFGPQQ